MSRVILPMLFVGLMMTASLVAAQTDVVDQQDFFVEAEVDNPTPFVGEEIWYVFRYFAYLRPTGLDERLPSFSGFWLGDSYDVKDNRVEVRNGRQYLVGEIWVNIVPLRDGKIEIEPAALHVPETIFRAGFDVVSDVIDVVVQPLPEISDTLVSGIGQFYVESSLDRDTAVLGEPVELRVDVTGQGNLEQMEPPALNLPNTWRVYRGQTWILGNALEGSRQRQKTFTWTIIPDRAGTHIIAPIRLTYFDPMVEAYQTTESDLLEVAVLPGADGLRVLPTLDISRSQSNIAIALYPVPGTMSRGGGTAAVPWLLWLAAPGLMAAVAGWVSLRAYYPRYRRRLRQRSASQVAIHRLEHLLAEDVSDVFPYASVMDILKQYVHDRSERITAETVAVTEINLQSEAGLSGDAAQVFATRYRQMSHVLYIPSALRPNPQGFFEEAVQWVQELENAWR